MEEQLKEPLRKAIAFLEEQGYGYAVIGGIAIAQWGRLRYTYDVDIKVLVPDTDYEGVQKAILTAFPKRARLQAPENPLIVAVEIGGVIVDFLLAIPGYEEMIIERAVQRNLNGLSVWISSAEDLIVQKAVAGRGKDWPDIEALLIAQDQKLDKAYIEDWLSQFAEALEQPELLEKYLALVERVKKLLSSG